MGRFNRGGKFGRRDSNRSDDGESGRFRRRDSNRPDEGEPRRFGRRDSGGFSGRESGRRSPEMHEVTCDECGRTCEVPFRPTSGKPVYCSDCFKKTGNARPRRPSQFSHESGENSESDKPNKYQHEFDQINEKLNKILKALELDD